MFFNGFNGFPAPVGVGYATSPDGYHWNCQVMEPPLSAISLTGGTLLGTNFFVTSALVEDDGTWVLYSYTLTGNTFNGPGGIGRATAQLRSVHGQLTPILYSVLIQAAPGTMCRLMSPTF